MQTHATLTQLASRTLKLLLYENCKFSIFFCYTKIWEYTYSNRESVDYIMGNILVSECWPFLGLKLFFMEKFRHERNNYERQNDEFCVIVDNDVGCPSSSGKIQVGVGQLGKLCLP